MVKSLACSGFAVPWYFGYGADQGKPEVEPEKIIQVSDFRFGKQTELNHKPVKMVKYKCRIVPLKFTGDVTVWIDAKTNLPMQRVIDASDKSNPKEVRGTTLIETYVQWTVNEPMEAKEFEVTKQ